MSESSGDDKKTKENRLNAVCNVLFHLLLTVFALFVFLGFEASRKTEVTIFSNLSSLTGSYYKLAKAHNELVGDRDKLYASHIMLLMNYKALAEGHNKLFGLHNELVGAHNRLIGNYKRTTDNLFSLYSSLATDHGETVVRVNELSGLINKKQ